MSNGNGCRFCGDPNLLERIATLEAALKLAKDMFIANDLSLPRTFEVIDAALEPEEL